MMSFISPRLRKPVWIAAAGAVFAAAWLVRGGPLWWVSIPVVIATAARAVSWYRMGGELVVAVRGHPGRGGLWLLARLVDLRHRR